MIDHGTIEKAENLIRAFVLWCSSVLGHLQPSRLLHRREGLIGKPYKLNILANAEIKTVPQVYNGANHKRFFYVAPLLFLESPFHCASRVTLPEVNSAAEPIDYTFAWGKLCFAVHGV